MYTYIYDRRIAYIIKAKEKDLTNNENKAIILRALSPDDLRWFTEQKVIVK